MSIENSIKGTEHGKRVFRQDSYQQYFVGSEMRPNNNNDDATDEEGEEEGE